jgi:hypothetical protein
VSKFNKTIHSGCDCYCFLGFVDSHHGHVISASFNIVSRPSLIELISLGTKFRRGFLSMLSIEESINKGLKMFVNKQEELLGSQGILSDWKAKVPLFVQERTHALSVVQTSLDSSLSVPLGDLDHLKSLQLRGSNLFGFFFVCSFRRFGSPKESPTPWFKPLWILLCLFL